MQIVLKTYSYRLPDSVQSLAFLNIAYHENLPGMYARNLLIAAGSLDYHEPVILETTFKTSKQFHIYGKNEKLFSDFKVYPNPCSEYIIIEYSRENSGGKLRAEFFNSKGVNIKTCLLWNQCDQIVIPFKDYPPGIYFIRFSVNGAKKAICRVIHQ